VKAEAIKLVFVVFEGGNNITLGKGLSIISVYSFEACLNKCSFGLGEEGGCKGVVINEEIGSKGNHNSKKAFLFPLISFASI